MNLKTTSLRRIDFWTLITILGYVIVLIFLIFPLFNIFKASFLDDDGVLSLANYREFFSKTYYTSAIPNNLLVSFGGTLGALVFGIPLAFFTTRYKIWGKTLLATLAVLSLLSPPLYRSLFLDYDVREQRIFASVFSPVWH